MRTKWGGARCKLHSDLQTSRKLIKIMSPFLLSLTVLSSFLLSSSAEEGFPPLPILQTEGSHYQNGYSTGQMFQKQILAAMENNTFFNRRLLQYMATDTGDSQLRGYLATAEQHYPQYVDEIRGMASGANITFNKMFLWNMKFEFNLMLEPRLHALPPPACSDLYLLGDSLNVMGHNEDGDAILISTGYLLNVTTVTGGERFLAYCYPGELCGNAFGYNYATKTVVTCNALFPKLINTSAIGRNFLNRALLGQSYSEVVTTLNHVRCSSGFSLNVGSSRKGVWSVYNFEVSSAGAVETVYDNGYGFHFNSYLHSPNVSQYSDPSSQHRLTRIQALPPATRAEDIVAYLGDTKDPQYPIYRTATPPDDAATIATAVFDLGSSVMCLYRGSPALTTPIMTVPLD